MYAPLTSTHYHSTLAEKMNGTMSFIDNVPQGTVMTLRIHHSQSKSTDTLQSQQAECSDIIWSDQSASRTAFDSPCSTSRSSSISSASSTSSDGSPQRAGRLTSTQQLHLRSTANNELLVQTIRILVSRTISDVRLRCCSAC
jgi:hypothetical protein